MEIDLGGSFYKMDSLPISSQECVNFYSHIPQRATPSKRQLFIPAGILQACTAGTNVFSRGGYNFLDSLYVVQGTGLYRIDQSVDGYGVASYTSVLVSGATLLPGSERVIMADNGQEGGQLMIVLPAYDTKFNAFIYTTAGGLVAVSDADFDGPVSDVNYVDGYFEFTKKEGQKFFISDLRDGSSYISTDFEAAEVSTDYNVRSFILNNQLIVGGVNSLQGFQNVGGTGFPFVYIQGSVQEKGFSSIYGVIEAGGNMYFLGGETQAIPSLWVTNGATTENISTTPIDQEIATYSQTVIESCFAWKYSQAGANFVAFTFPGQRCFVYDTTTREWHTRQSVNSMGEFVTCRVAWVVKVYGVLMVGDTMSTKIGVLSRDVVTEYGGEIPRYFVTPQFDNEGNPFFIDSVELVMNGGDAELTVDPIASLSISRNGGRSFEFPLERSTGLTGEYNLRTIWGQCGRVAREACFRMDLYGAVKWAITKLEVNFS